MSLCYFVGTWIVLDARCYYRCSVAPESSSLSSGDPCWRLWRQMTENAARAEPNAGHRVDGIECSMALESVWGCHSKILCRTDHHSTRVPIFWGSSYFGPRGRQQSIHRQGSSKLVIGHLL